MPWCEVSTMSLREEFVMLALHEGSNRRELCRRFGVSPKTGYKWLNRYRAHGEAGLLDQSRRPHHSPQRTREAMEEAVVAMRRKHPAWGGRKIRRRLEKLGYRGVPSPSTLTAILRRQGWVAPRASARAFQRFEHDAPNRLWQMDFKGHFALDTGRCHPLTVLDDHSRFNLLLRACANEQGATVRQALCATFSRYGLPERILIDNGAPWGSDAPHPLTPLTVWLMRLDIGVIHTRPYHPQTLGKDERFHRTLSVELIGHRRFRDLAQCQRRFDRWRDSYNLERPHEALGMEVPVSRYQPSARAFSETLAPIEYAPGDIVRKVQAQGELFFHGHVFRISKALRGYPVALRPTQHEAIFSVHFCQTKVADIDLRKAYRST
jgi:transposase InsO family protein